ncbi:MAG: phosphatidylcholine/phosphatidylserine synthase [Sphingobium sp.]|nr:phosphatidylcholine/phosphatidylserine synthase [Sphingobium sp.]MBP6111074.1 phosphatidylcholine/phosphatidylserine synthase [Sphingobium sp.]MBP8670158.1 phosphatidylcholine/phosphatidylserine synthase [Sphingobium sp.]MBP9157192.1 phosphatidylcholine/phosphatidylserine synthase [Sphingobium sp.]MCC6482516.1 phosphatidylcholine/phosphatidylserine synthase [Sphingomonadaceae bacterium]
MRRRRAIPRGLRRGISLRQVAPNAVTAMALCFGLTGVRFAMSGQWEFAVASVILAGVLDGLDGRIARLLQGESRFGAELDSLSDCIAFGVSPAIIIYLWSLQHMPKLGWVFALAHALMCALRLARFNAAIDADEQPHKSAGFLTGVPAPTGAGLLFVPLYCWFVTDNDLFRAWYVVAPWTALVAFLMISSLATYSWSALRLRRTIRLEAIALAGLLAALLLTVPWLTLLVISTLYLAMIPFGVNGYRKVRAATAKS